MAETNGKIKMPHNIILEDRRRLTVSGVSDIDRFDDQSVVVFTEMGDLTVRGSDLHVNRLSLEVGEIAVEGNIEALQYADNGPKASGFFSKVFR